MKHYWVTVILLALTLSGGLVAAYADVKSDIARHEQSLCLMEELPQDMARMEEKVDWIIKLLEE